MNRPSHILYTIFLAFLLVTANSFAEDTNRHYLLLNDDQILTGEIITFQKGFLFFKQEDKILKISPAHFKGVFSSHPDAERAMVLLNRHPKPHDRPKGTPHTKNPLDQLSSIYAKAREITEKPDAGEHVKGLFKEVSATLRTPKDLLNNKVFSETALLAAVSDLHNLDDSLAKIIKERFNRETMSELSKEDREVIESRLQTLSFLITHTVSEKE